MSELKPRPCPICGAELKIYGPEDWRPTFNDPDSGGEPYNAVCDCGFQYSNRSYDYTEFIACLNRRVQPANEPLTIEQLLEMERRGEGIYVTHADGSPIFRGKQYTAAVLDRIAAFGAMGYHLQAIYGRGLTLAEDDCGKTWLAYRRPPERSET